MSDYKGLPLTAIWTDNIRQLKRISGEDVKNMLLALYDIAQLYTGTEQPDIDFDVLFEEIESKYDFSDLNFFETMVKSNIAGWGKVVNNRSNGQYGKMGGRPRKNPVGLSNNPEGKTENPMGLEKTPKGTELKGTELKGMELNGAERSGAWNARTYNTQTIQNIICLSFDARTLANSIKATKEWYDANPYLDNLSFTDFSKEVCEFVKSLQNAS